GGASLPISRRRSRANFVTVAAPEFWFYAIVSITGRACARSFHDTLAAALRSPRVRRDRVRPGTRSRGGISPERGGARPLSRRAGCACCARAQVRPYGIHHAARRAIR